MRQHLAAVLLTLSAPILLQAQAIRITGFGQVAVASPPLADFTPGAVTFTLDVPANRAPTSFDEVVAEYAGVQGRFRQGNRAAAVTGTVQFFIADFGGGLLFSSTGGVFVLDAGGPQLFSGPTSAPRFTTGSFTLTNFEDDPALVAVQRNITIVAFTAPVPEPSSAVLLLSAAAVPLVRRLSRASLRRVTTKVV